MCDHEDFESSVTVNRHTETDGGPVVGYSADVVIRCAQCKEDFCFRGMGVGVSQMEPMTDVIGKEARLPIHPMTDPTAGIGLLGFSVGVRTYTDDYYPGVDTSKPDDHGMLGG